MNKLAKKNDWVRIEQVVLTPEQRPDGLPVSTKKVSLKCWINGFLLDERAEKGDTVTIRTNADRKVSGVLFDIWPAYNHHFGKQQPSLIHVGHEVKELMKEG